MCLKLLKLIFTDTPEPGELSNGLCICICWCAVKKMEFENMNMLTGSTGENSQPANSVEQQQETERNGEAGTSETNSSAPNVDANTLAAVLQFLQKHNLKVLWLSRPFYSFFYIFNLIRFCRVLLSSWSVKLKWERTCCVKPKQAKLMPKPVTCSPHTRVRGTLTLMRKPILVIEDLLKILWIFTR